MKTAPRKSKDVVELEGVAGWSPAEMRQEQARRLGSAEAQEHVAMDDLRSALSPMSTPDGD